MPHEKRSDVTDVENSQTELVGTSAGCVPGGFLCVENDQWLATCQKDGYWKKSLYCGNNGHKGW